MRVIIQNIIENMVFPVVTKFNALLEDYFNSRKQTTNKKITNVRLFDIVSNFIYLFYFLLSYNIPLSYVIDICICPQNHRFRRKFVTRYKYQSYTENM